MALRIWSIWAVMLTSVLLLFQNCGPAGNSAASDPLVFKIDESELPVDPTMDAATKVELCSAFDYVCEHRIYAPGISGIEEGQICADVIVFGRPATACAKLIRISSDSASALRNCSDCGPQDGEPGGRYNYEEFFCYHPNFNLGGKVAIQNRGAGTLEDNLLETIKICEETLAL